MTDQELLEVFIKDDYKLGNIKSSYYCSLERINGPISSLLHIEFFLRKILDSLDASKAIDIEIFDKLVSQTSYLQEQIDFLFKPLKNFINIIEKER